jgi:hypothetical protein
MMRRSVLALIVVPLFAACGDAETNDARGYTKAPLERPNAVIRGEEPSAMREFGEPRLPVREPIEFPDTAGN